MKRLRKSTRSATARYNDHHRFEHWYVSNQVYFITARCRDRFPAFDAEEAKQVFGDQFDHDTNEATLGRRDER